MLRYFLLLVLILLLPLLMLPLAKRFLVMAEKQEKKLFLYNSKRSLTSNKLWVYANNFIGKFWSISGLVLFFLNLILYMSFSKVFIDNPLFNYLFVIGSMLLTLALVFISFIIIEIKLIKRIKEE